MIKFISSSVQAKFTLAISFTVLLFFVILLLISFNYFKSYSIDKSKEYASAILSETNSKINMFFSEIENIAQSLSNLNAVKNVDTTEMKNIFISTVLSRRDNLRAIYLGTETGEMYEWGFGEGFKNNTPSFPADYDPRLRPWYKKAVEQSGFSISEPYIYASINALGITGVIKVYSAGKTFVGVLGIDIILQGLSNILEDINTLKRSKIILIDSNNNILANQFEKTSGNITKLQKYAPAEKMKGGKGYFIDTIERKKVFVSYMRNQATNWILLTAIPYHEIMEFSSSTISIIFLTDILLIFILVIIIIILTRKIVTGHLENLAGVIKRIGDGDLKARFNVNGTDEFATIGKLFNELAEIRERYTHRMEEEIKKRTQEVTKLQLENTRLRIMEEKERIFRNLHDSLGARLTNVFISNNVAQSVAPSENELLVSMLGRIEKNTEAGINDLKEIIFDHDSNRTIIDFTRLVIVNTKNRLELKNITLKYKIKNRDTINSMPRNIRFEAEKILKELVTNVLKHSEATAVAMDIRASRRRLFLSFKDNGVGFIYKENVQKGFGLNSIKKRVEKLGGHFKIKTNPGNGTKFILSIQINEGVMDQ